MVGFHGTQPRSTKYRGILDSIPYRALLWGLKYDVNLMLFWAQGIGTPSSGGSKYTKGIRSQVLDLPWLLGPDTVIFGLVDPQANDSMRVTQGPVDGVIQAQ